MGSISSQEEHLVVTAHRLLGDASLIAGKAEFLRRHRVEVSEEICDRWLQDIESNAKDLCRCLSLLARGIVAELPDY